MTNWRAMQAAGAVKQTNKSAPAHEARPSPYDPHGVLPRYMAGGSWRASLSKGGART